ncbi:MAG TPA: hypothetical protein VMD91_14755 [Candidatus Sulfotelmatobacter sp.]|nr:hypothetical protein [Candidatus Sulfotelmatobacter sp.]
MPARLVSAALWALLVLGVLLIVAMVWHPWVTPWTGAPSAR